jgi:hypothetical protein
VKHLVGFDVRQHPDEFVGKLWLPDRRERFLLNPHVRWPLSVDTLVWPSVFAPNTPLSDDYKRLIGLENALEVKDACFLDEFWISLDRMEHCYQHSAGLDSRGVAIVIRLIRDANRELTDAEALWLINDVSPAEVSEAWSLGYDVAEEALISGLSNCGYGPAEKAALQAAWPGKLNDYGLFRELEDAEQFRTLTDTRVPEHAPFSVFELLSLERLRE